MARKPPLPVDDDGEVPELSDAELAELRPARDVLPAALLDQVKRQPWQRGPGKKPSKVHVSLRIDADTLDALQAQGRTGAKKSTLRSADL